MQQGIPTEEEVLRYFTTLSNQGRWGVDDQLGTLNFVTPEKTRRAVGLVREGVTLSCARTVRFEAGPDSPSPPIHYMLESGEGWASGDKISSRRNQASVDFFGMVFHGHTITHLDSLAHFFWDGKMYNGRPAHLVSTSLGATVESVEVAKDGILTRGVLVDVPMIRGIDWVERGEGIMPAGYRGGRTALRLSGRRGRYPDGAHRPAQAPQSARSGQSSWKQDQRPARRPVCPCSTNGVSP